MAYRSRNSGTSGNSLSDRDMLLDLLSSGKYMSHLYDTAVMESNNSTIRDTFESMQQDEHQIAEEIFNFMQQEGWYSSGSSKQNFSQRQSNMQSENRYTANFGRNKMSGQNKSHTANRSMAGIGSNNYID